MSCLETTLEQLQVENEELHQENEDLRAKEEDLAAENAELRKQLEEARKELRERESDSSVATFGSAASISAPLQRDQVSTDGKETRTLSPTFLLTLFLRIFSGTSSKDLISSNHSPSLLKDFCYSLPKELEKWRMEELLGLNQDQLEEIRRRLSMWKAVRRKETLEVPLVKAL